MSVYLRGGVYHYDFEYRGQRHRGTTGQRIKDDAQLVESRIKLQLRQDLAGIGIADPKTTPRIQDWAEIYYDTVKNDPAIRRPERIADLIRVVLRFFGAKPTVEHDKVRLVAGEPYHDLHLGHIVADPYWVIRFERWMQQRVVRIPTKADAKPRTRPIAGQTRNQYRSVMSQMFELARSAGYRQRTRILTNPFDGLKRDRGGRRTAVIQVTELADVLRQASYHVRLAIAIGALAPKLRLGNILALRWDRHLDTDLRLLTIPADEHKTGHATARALVLPVSEQLRAILTDARTRAKQERIRSPHVVTYRGAAITELRGGLKNACVRAGVSYGRFLEAGITFHTLRHTAATMLAELGVAEGLRKETLGHEHLATTQLYTHVRPVHLEAPVEQLSAALPIEALVTMPWRRASNRGVQTSAPGAAEKTVGTRPTKVSDFRTKARARDTRPGSRRSG